MSDQYLLRGSSVAARKLGGEMMLMSAVDSSLFSLNGVASVIWESADGTTPLREIVERKICQEYDVEPEAAYQDALGLVEELSKHGILVVSDSPITSGEGS
jgi:hypothetical protein